MKYFDIPINPIGAPRQTQRDRWKKRPVVLKYHAYRDVVRLFANQAQYTISGILKIEFHIEVPKSKSGKQKQYMYGRPHDQKPDIDNLVKAFMDCFGEDKTIYQLQAVKRWSEKGFIRVHYN